MSEICEYEKRGMMMDIWLHSKTFVKTYSRAPINSRYREILPITRYTRLTIFEVKLEEKQEQKHYLGISKSNGAVAQYTNILQKQLY